MAMKEEQVKYSTELQLQELTLQNEETSLARHKEREKNVEVTLESKSMELKTEAKLAEETATEKVTKMREC